MHQTNGPTRTQSTDTIGLSQPHPGIRRFAVRVMAILLVAAAIIASVVADARARVPEGIAIAGVAVGGVSAAEAERLVSARAVELAKRPVVVIGPQGTVHTSGVGLRARPRVAAAVAAAGVHRFGRARDWLDGGPPRQVQLSWAVDALPAGVQLDGELDER